MKHKKGGSGPRIAIRMQHLVNGKSHATGMQRAIAKKRQQKFAKARIMKEYRKALAEETTTAGPSESDRHTHDGAHEDRSGGTTAHSQGLARDLEGPWDDRGGEAGDRMAQEVAREPRKSDDPASSSNGRSRSGGGNQKRRKKSNGGDPFRKEREAAEAKRREVEQKRQDMEDARKAKEKKLGQRKRRQKLYTQRDKKGRPIVKHRINDMLERIKKSTGVS